MKHARSKMSEKEYQRRMAQARIEAAHKLECKAIDMGIAGNTVLTEYLLSLEERIANLEDPHRYD